MLLQVVHFLSIVGAEFVAGETFKSQMPSVLTEQSTRVPDVVIFNLFPRSSLSSIFAPPSSLGHTTSSVLELMTAFVAFVVIT